MTTRKARTNAFLPTGATFILQIENQYPLFCGDMCNWFRSIVLRSDRKSPCDPNLIYTLDLESRGMSFHLPIHLFNKFIAHAGIVLDKENTELKRIDK